MREDKLLVYPRGVNVDRFHPNRRNGILRDRYGADGDAVNLLYVGRVSKEKNLHVLAAAFTKVVKEGANVRLVVVGDGPYREEMEQAIAGTPVLFTGYVDGE